MNNVEFELISMIVNFGMGSKVLKKAISYGVHGGSIALARGTVNNKIWDYLGLSDIRKEIVYMVAEHEVAYQALEKLNEEFKFCKPNHGIAFTTSIGTSIGTKFDLIQKSEVERKDENMKYQVITTIVDKGKAEDVIDAARKAGSKGGTIINGRGSGIYETSKVFHMDIEPEKEIVLILSEIEMTEAIVNSIREELKIAEPGKGILFVQDVNQTYGIAK